MLGNERRFGAIVIGGGYFGCRIAIHLARAGVKPVALIEESSDIMTKASWINQARVHNGYHYPRSSATALSCKENYEKFQRDNPDVILKPREAVYAIARESKVSADQFQTFCDEIGIRCQPNRELYQSLFDYSTTEAAFVVDEVVFDANKLQQRTRRELTEAGVIVRCDTRAQVRDWDSDWVHVEVGAQENFAQIVINATYADLDAVGIPLSSRLKRERAEIAIICPPPELRGLAITVMDGPYFSTMPFPPLGEHSLSHVNYTPHAEWTEGGVQPPLVDHSRFREMQIDSERFLPLMSRSKYLHSLFATKAVLVSSERDDARPILLETSAACPRVASVLGSKIDTVDDVLSAAIRLLKFAD